MPRYFIQLCFEGSRYHGWQLQKNAHSVQAEVNRVLSTVLGGNITTTGCGRTDTGVHALEFFAHFDVKKEIQSARDLIYHLNKILPDDIAVQWIFRVQGNAHARYDALKRTYRYHLRQGKDPFALQRSYFFAGDLDFRRMNRAAALLKNCSDFSSFSKSRTQVKTNLCRVFTAEWAKKNGGMVFTITAGRFLRNMVRAIVGTLLEVGQGKITLEQFSAIIEKRDRRAAGVSVPACGLYLYRVHYPKKIMAPIP